MVDLQGVDRQTSQIGERGETGAEIVQREAHALAGAGTDQADDAGEIVQRGAFQDFDAYPIGRQIGVRRQHVLQEFRETRAAQLLHEDVDADRDVEPFLAPVIGLLDRVTQDPGADTASQVVVAVHQGQEFRRSHQAEDGMLPAHQGFHPHHQATPAIDDGLIEQAQLVVRHRFLDQSQGGAVVALPFFKNRVELVIAVFPGFLGQIHGVVGMPQQGVGVAVVAGKEGDADAGGNRDGLLGEGIG